MEELAPELRVRDAVDRVADDRAARSPRDGRGSGASVPSRGGRRSSACRSSSRSTSKCVTASRGVSVSSEHAGRLAPVAADRRLDAAAPGARTAPHERLVAPLERARRTRSRRPRYASSLRATTSRPDVSRSRRWTMPGRSGVSPPATRAERARARACRRRMPGRGMHDDPGRLVHDEQVLVLVRDPERRAPRPRARPGPGPAPRARAPRRPSSRWLLGRASPSRSAPRSSSSRSAAAREPISGSEARNRSSRSPGRLLGDDERRGVRGGPCGLGPAGLVSPRTSATNRIATPITMKESARLKAGQ